MILIIVSLFKEILVNPSFSERWMMTLTLTNLTSLVTKSVLLTLGTHYFTLPFTDLEFNFFLLSGELKRIFCCQATQASRHF